MKISLPATGVYDKTTAASVREFQKRVNLRPSGVVNRATWLALMTTSAQTG